MAAGYNHVDIEELRKRGIRTSNTPKVLNDAVADIAILLTLAAPRRLREARLSIEHGEWMPNDLEWMCGQDITNSTVGIIGFGQIGQTVARRLKGFDLRQLLYTGHKEKKEGIELGAKFVSLNTLIEDSDFIIVVAPLTTETKHMCNEEFFSKMKKTAVFINVGRGEVVDQPALINALKNHTIFAAGLDVMTPEPIPPNHELLTLPNAVVTPHLGTATNETRQSMANLAAQNILRCLAGEEMLTPVLSMDIQKQRPKVLITNTGVSQEAIDLLRKYCDVVVNETPTRDAILSKVKGVDAIFVKKPAVIDKEVLDAAGSQLKVVSLLCRGLDSCDTDEIKKRNIKLTHLHDENAITVANFAVLLLLAASRRYHEGRLGIEQNTWVRADRKWMVGHGLQKSTVGIIGLGNIGQALVKRLIHFDVKRFLYTGPKEKKEGKELSAEFVSLNTLLEESDFVIMGCPLNNETNGMCNAEFFSKMKRKAVFVNVCRSGLVDQPALIQALKSGDIFAAGLDVMTPEPLPVDHELLKLPNVVLTPHVAFKTRDTMKQMSVSTAVRLLKELNLQM
ncbi:uncharacterized protein [Diabrotica undecimpunctata]